GYAIDRRAAAGSTAMTSRCPSLRRGAVRVGSFVGCLGSRIRRAFFSSFPILRANSLLDTSRAHVLYHGKFGHNPGLNRYPHQTATTRPCSRQRQIPSRIGEQRESKPLLGPRLPLSLSITFRDP